MKLTKGFPTSLHLGRDSVVEAKILESNHLVYAK